MAVEAHKTTVEDLMIYSQKNPAKFLHKFGEIDFGNLPPNFGNMIPQYKRMVIAERVRRTTSNLPEDVPAITPWMFAPWKKEEVKVAPVVTTTENVGDNTSNGANTGGTN